MRTQHEGERERTLAVCLPDGLLQATPFAADQRGALAGAMLMRIGVEWRTVGEGTVR